MRGNIIGQPNYPTYAAAPGIWTMNEARNAVRSENWPLSIITEGLQIHLDASNDNSYPGSGAVWTNLANTSLNASLANTTFTSTLGGGIVFGSTSVGYIGSGADFAGGGYTIQMLLRHTGTVDTSRTQRYFTMSSSPVEGPVLRHQSTSVASLHGYIFDAGSTFRTIDIPNIIYSGTYHWLTYKYDGSVFRLYSNETEVGSLSQVITLPTPLGIVLSVGGEYFEGEMYAVYYYNRALSTTEQTHNYQVIRRKLGI